ncbi:MAG TPA: EAL domain-containing protein [Woeseiaceae bacterium]|nr:EAL domain-containing protein [Woeseiaceae bacterium]
MNERQGISIAVLTTNQDDVEIVNKALRDAGHAAHCHWIRQSDAFDSMLRKDRVELIILNCDSYPDTIRQVIRQKDAYLPEVPVIATSRSVDEATIDQAMQQGAADLVSMKTRSRLQSVVERELRAFRVEQALNSTLQSATGYRKQLYHYMQGSTSAIAYVQEGIIVEVNRAWLRLFQVKEADEVRGLPLMDNFEPQSQAAIKGAIIATTKGKWQPGEILHAKSRIVEQGRADLELDFQLVDFGDGPQIQVRIAPPEKPPEEPTKLVHEALKRDPTTLFFNRATFLERITRRLASKPKSGMHALAYVKPDDFSEVRSKVGILATEEVLSQFAEELRKRLHPRDVAGRFEGTVIMALLERGNERDAEVWGQQLVDHMNAHKFRIGDQTVQLTCTVGVCAVSGIYSSLDELVAAAAEAHKLGKGAGGNTVRLSESADADTRLRKHDAIWVKRIKEALKDSRFRLANLPIAGLRSDTVKMYDMLVRMIDEQGSPILPSEFMPAAGRNNLMKLIDRWIMAASINFAFEEKADRVFVRLSRQSMQDSQLGDWLKKELTKKDIKPSVIVVQIPEQEAAKYIKQTRDTIEQFRKLGLRFALEHYGVDKNRFQILDILKPDYIKIDGELMHALTTDMQLQESVRQLSAAAEQRKIETIAERVENANAMAVLFQLGVNYMQGHYVHEPEVILQEAVNVTKTTLEAIANS